MAETAAFLVIVLGVLGLLVVRSQFARLTIYEYQRGLRYRGGRFVDLVGPGQLWVYRPTTVVRVVDARIATVTIPGQEVITSDGASVRVSLTAQQRLADPAKAMHEVDDYQSAVYSTLQIGLRDAVGSLTLEGLLEKRDAIGADVLRRSSERASAVGVELVSVDVKDVMLSASTKRAYAQVVEARQQGLATLEKARGETAALRSLANAARMVEGSPALLQLRWLQQLESRPGNTVILDLAGRDGARSEALRTRVEPSEPAPTEGQE